MLTAPDRGQALEPRLCAATRKLAGRKTGGPLLPTLPASDRRVSRDLHLRILDAVEDRQYTSRPARSRVVAAGVALLLVVAAGGVQLQRTRAEALAASAPTIIEAAPASGAVDVSLDGEFRVQFGRRPVGTPSIQHIPPDGKQTASHWDGAMLVVDYAGLHFGARYQLILTADYNSNLRDSGRFEKRWSFTAEGAPRLVATVPAEGGAAIARYGMLTVDFSRRPTVDPTVTLSPPARLSPGFWSGSTWRVQYSDLRPLTRYTADIVLASTDPQGRIHRSWSFASEPGAPPAGVPVVWYSTFSHSDPAYLDVPNRLLAIDWTGNVVGTVYANSAGRQNADGSWITAQDGVDAFNARDPSVTAHDMGSTVWSDVSGRFCHVAISWATGASWLETAAIGGRPRVVAQLGPASASPMPITCSVAADRAVVGDQGRMGFTNVRVFALSTGRLLFQHRYAGESVIVTSSPDGRYLAEATMYAATAPSGIIRRTSDGAIVARLGSRRVVSFSSDGLLVLTAPAWGSTGPIDVRLLNWRTGATLWRLDGDPGANGQSIYGLAQPNGSAFMVALGNPSGPGDVDGVFLVHPDGRAEKIVTGSVFLASYPS